MLPALFVPHGSPPFVAEPSIAAARLANTVTRLPQRPRAIVVVSPHWDTAMPVIGTASRPETIHDFWGFPDHLYDLRYRAPGAPALANAIADRLAAAGFPVQTDERGLDHGAWIPLKLMFPEEDIPVVPMSIQSRLGTEHHYRLGQALAPLLADDVLVLGTGNLTHNLHDVQSARVSGGGTPPYVHQFADWAWQRIEAGDTAGLLDYRRRAPGAERAHPTDDHLLPLFVALGAAGSDARAERLHSGVDYHVLAMDAYAFHPAPGGRQ
ncbi:MAG: dioxygenase [Rhodocyclales bacterium]|nr:dioxygenase [Rhodocyclales bacterium]